MAGSGFTRRYNYVPGSQVITLIEGIIILDLPPPGNIAGVSTGVVCLVGEFADNTYGVAVDTNGNVTQSPNPVQIFSGQDLLNKVGGFDPTIGDFGGTMGNGFVELRNKSFSQLVLLPVSLASSRAVRLFRQLPFNASATLPTPVVPMSAGAVQAATQFASGTNYVSQGAAKAFTGNQPYASGIDGSVTAAVGSTETFNSLGGNFAALINPNGSVGVQKGDALVVGAPIISALLGSILSAGATNAILQAPGWTGYPSTGLLQIDSEFMTYSGVTAGPSGGASTAFTGLTRGLQNSAGATHQAGAVAVGMNNVGTYRVNAIPGATALTLERQDGSAFSSSNSFSASGQPWRLHPASDADTGVGINANAAAFTVPARPTVASIAAATALTPVVAPPLPTYNSWNPLSGLGMVTDPTTGLVYTAAVQAPNAVSSASLDALYLNALTIMQSQNLPEASVNILWAARKSANIRSGLRSSVDNESAIGVGRIAVVSPDLTSVVTTSQAVATNDPGVGANRDERLIYSWPAVQTFVPEAVNVNIKGADGNTYQNGIIDIPADGWLVAVMSNLNPELNPGQAGPPVPSVLAPITGLARNAPTLGINDYIAMRQNGICGIRIDRTVGPVFQSGITTSLVPGQTTIQRRRMADFIEDSISVATAPLAKLPLTLLFQDNLVSSIDSFLNNLQSPNNPALQRINAYYVDDKSGNTAALLAQGVFVVIVGVQTTPTADFIVYQFNIGNGVVIPQQIG